MRMEKRQESGAGTLSFSEAEAREIQSIRQYEQEMLTARRLLSLAENPDFPQDEKQRMEAHLLRRKHDRDQAIRLIVEKSDSLPPIQRYKELCKLPDARQLNAFGEASRGVNLSENQLGIRSAILMCRHEFEDMLTIAGVDSRVARSVLLEIMAEIRRESGQAMGDREEQLRDGKEEWRRIMEVGKEADGLSHEEKRKIQRERLGQRRQALAEQLAGIGQINAEAERLVVVDGVTERGELEKALLRKAGQYGLTPEQIDTYKIAFLLIESRHVAVEKVCEHFKGKDSDFFAELFGIPPIGKISIIKGPVSIGVACEDVRDYEKISGEKPDEDEPKTDRPSTTDGSAGVAVRIPVLRRAVFAINASGAEGKPASGDPKRFEAIRIHEEKHTVDYLTHLAQELGPAKVARKQPEPIEETPERTLSEFRVVADQRRESAEQHGKWEILAYLKDGTTSLAELRQKLLKSKNDGGLYDYFARDTSETYRDRRAKLDEGVAGDIERLEHKRYEATLLRALESVRFLRSIGVATDRIIGIFQAEPLANWQKVRERVMLDADMRQRLSDELSTAQREVVGWGGHVRRESGILSTMNGWFDSLRAPLNGRLKPKWRSHAQRLEHVRMEETRWKNRLDQLTAEKERIEKKSQ